MLDKPSHTHLCIIIERVLYTLCMYVCMYDTLQEPSDLDIIKPARCPHFSMVYIQWNLSNPRHHLSRRQCLEMRRPPTN